MEGEVQTKLVFIIEFKKHQYKLKIGKTLTKTMKTTLNMFVFGSRLFCTLLVSFKTDN